jgi:hypothetical protein
MAELLTTQLAKSAQAGRAEEHNGSTAAADLCSLLRDAEQEAGHTGAKHLERKSFLISGIPDVELWQVSGQWQKS